MSSSKFSDDFQRDAVAQITERGYPVREVSQRLGVSPYSLHAWKKKFAKGSSGDAAGRSTRLNRNRRRVTPRFVWPPRCAWHGPVPWALSPLDRRLYAREGLAPLLAVVGELSKDGKEAACAEPQGSLAYWPRRRLRRSAARLAKIKLRWSRA